MRLRWRWIIYALLALAAAAPAGAFLVAWSGVYSVSASRGHFQLVDFFLRFGMENSVRAHAPDTQPPALDDPNLIRLGAGHFYGGCANCHGAPGMPVGPVAGSMLPPPPDLKEKVGTWSDQELFWIVKHGLKYTGMPGWPAQQRDDEVWPLVAFLRRLPGLNANDYHVLAFSGFEREPPDGHELAMRGSAIEAAAACARCHGAGERLPASALVPRLHGQPEEMLLAALEAYADGKRYSGIMQPVAAALAPEERREMARYYAGLPPPAGQGATDSVLAENGRRLATEGLPDAQIPACDDCHGASALPLFPRLAGQNAPYLAGQLRLWRKGPRSHTETDAIMAPIAQRLSEQQINELTAYYANLPADRAASAPAVRKASEP
jgi:cytochrome c553